MSTKKVPVSECSTKLPSRIVQNRIMSNTQWIDEHASGTLRDNKSLGFVWSIQCLSERLAYTFGYGFSAYKSHLVSFNSSISECDESAYTMAGRWAKRYIAKSLFQEDVFEVKYVVIKDEKSLRVWEGIALVVLQTSAQFIPDNMMVVAKIARFDHSSCSWDTAINFA